MRHLCWGIFLRNLIGFNNEESSFTFFSSSNGLFRRDRRIQGKIDTGNHMNFIFLTNGLGETVHGVAVAQYARRKGIGCRFLNATPTSHNYVQEFGLDSVLLSSKKSQKEVNRIIEGYSPDVIFCCNSKTTRNIFSPNRRLTLSSLIVSLDSNWLFEEMPVYFDRFFVVFPPLIFRSNRNYKITDKRVKPVGFIPSGYKFSRFELNSVRKKICSRKEKLVFAYFGRGGTFRHFLVNILLETVAQLNKEALKLKLILVSETSVRKRKDVTFIKWFKKEKEFNKYLAASDCVVCHHGMPTFSKAIFAKVPIISFVPEVIGGVKKPSALSEVEPFEELGLCVSLPYSAKPERLKKALEQILFDQKGAEIKKEQSKYLLKGEEVVLNEVNRMLKEKRT